MLEKNDANAIRPGGLKITLAGFVDAIIAIVIEIILIFYRQPTFIYKWIANINTSLFAFIILIVSRLLFILIFDRSLGMMLLRLVFLNHEEKQLSIIEKLCAGFFLLIRGVEYYEYQ